MNSITHQNAILEAREIMEGDIPYITRYWTASDPVFMQSMGVDLEKIPAPESIQAMLNDQLMQSYKNKNSYCIIWLINDHPSGHSNINKIQFGKEAFMHLHLWDVNARNLGFGTELLKKTIPFFFTNYRLEHLYSEPFAFNPAPHKTLERAGFKCEKEYITIPGSVNFEQQVKRWHLSKEMYMNLYEY